MFENYSFHDGQSDLIARSLLANATAETPLADMLGEMSRGGAPRRRVPVSALTGIMGRDLTKAGNAGYLVSTDVGTWEPLLRGYSVVAEAGIRVLSGLTGDIVIPKTTAGSTANWLSTEGTAITPSQPTFAQVALTPKICAVLTHCSRALLQQAVAAESVIRAGIAADVGAAVDTAVFQGSGNSGQPLGILNTAGTHSQSGTSLGHTGLLNMLEKVTAAGARYSRLTWFAAPDAAEILGGRERSAGSGYNLDDGKILGRPAVITTSVPNGSLVLCDPDLVMLGLFDGQGAAIERDDYSAFTSGGVSFRLMLGVDVAVLAPAAFAKAVSIT